VERQWEWRGSGSGGAVGVEGEGANDAWEVREDVNLRYVDEYLYSILNVE